MSLHPAFINRTTLAAAAMIRAPLHAVGRLRLLLLAFFALILLLLCSGTAANRRKRRGCGCRRHRCYIRVVRWGGSGRPQLRSTRPTSTRRLGGGSGGDISPNEGPKGCPRARDCSGDRLGRCKRRYFPRGKEALRG